MENNHKTAPKILLHKGQGKDTPFQEQMQKVFLAFREQMQKVFLAFREQPKTINMVSLETGILRVNFLYYVNELKRQNLIRIVKEDICPISKHRAYFYTTNPDLFPSNIKPLNNVRYEIKP